MKRLIQGNFFLVFVALIAANPAAAQQITNTLYNFDEFGHGSITLLGTPQGTFGASLLPDTTLGGLANWNVLTYTLPFAGTAGDVLVFDPATNGTPLLDVLRFDGNSHVIVYSDDINGLLTPADTPGPPNAFQATLLEINREHVSSVLGFASFTPMNGQPGYDASDPSYLFLDPGVVPEPRTGLLALGSLGLLAMMRLRRKLVSKETAQASG